MKKILAISGSVLAASALGTLAINMQSESPSSNKEVELIVVYDKGATTEQQNDALNNVDIKESKLINPLTAESGSNPPMRAVTVVGSEKDAEKSIEKSDGVKAVVKDVEFTPQASSNDPYFLNGNQEGLYGVNTSPLSSSYGISASRVWDTTTTGSSDVHVAVIDTYININHPDLKDNIWTNPFDLPDGIDNDGNGYVDDIHGWDTIRETNNVHPFPICTDTGGWPETAVGVCYSHGIATTGLIGAVGGNGIGMAGVAWDVSIIPVPVCAAGCESSDIIQAIDYITDLKARHGINIVAINASLGSVMPRGYGDAIRLPTKLAIEAAGDEDILYIGAAGNEGIGVGTSNDPDNPNVYPAGMDCNADSLESGSYDCIISVNGINEYNGYSGNYGNSVVDISAPFNSGTQLEDYEIPSLNGEEYTTNCCAGTSISAPFVTGAVVLYKSAHPDWSAKQIKQAILDDGVEINGADTCCTVSGKRLDLSVLAGDPKPPKERTGSFKAWHIKNVPPDVEATINFDNDPDTVVVSVYDDDYRDNPQNVTIKLCSEINEEAANNPNFYYGEACVDPILRTFTDSVNSNKWNWVGCPLTFDPGCDLIEWPIDPPLPAGKYFVTVRSQDSGNSFLEGWPYGGVFGNTKILSFTVGDGGGDPPAVDVEDLHWRKPFNSDKLRLRVKTEIGDDTVSKIFAKDKDAVLRSWETGSIPFSFSEFYPYSSGEPDIEVIIDNFGASGWSAQTTAVVNEQNHISKAYVRLNTFYFTFRWSSNTVFARPAFCHQLGHALGLVDNAPEPWSEEPAPQVLDTSSDNSCMNEEGIPLLLNPSNELGYKYNIPNSEDVEAINALYSHPEPAPVESETAEVLVDFLPPFP